MEAYSFPFCIFVSIMTVNYKTVDHSSTLIRNTRQKGRSGQLGQSDEQQGLTIATS